MQITPTAYLQFDRRYSEIPLVQWRRQDCFLRGQTPDTIKFVKLKVRKRHLMAT